MKFILKILLAPVMLTLWLIECLCKLALKLSSVIFVLALHHKSVVRRSRSQNSSVPCRT